MSRRRRREEAPPPLSGAGLMRFFEEEIRGIKIRPEYVVISAFILIATVILAHAGIFTMP
ncbi:MAG: preprotein translocase subunit Sec61beta [Thermoprotei archaeon]|nr:MAG: preprotein translocase subunit Sec61beta [Thermofilum sp. ex4484_79]RLE61752.1 MAG: preprotein translocase subunit Sec61beta [Thermoprotei archaeon]